MRLIQFDEEKTFVSLSAIFIRWHTLLCRIVCPTLCYPIIPGSTLCLLIGWVYVTCFMGMAYKNLHEVSQIFLRCFWADLDLILNMKRFVRIWIWMNLRRSYSSDWWDVWFWTYPLFVVGSCAGLIVVLRVTGETARNLFFYFILGT